jgi:ankyrin repeat protein
MGADVNSVDAFGLTPLMHAAKRGNIDIVKLLTESTHIEIDKVHKLPRSHFFPCHRWTALMFAANEGHRDVCSYLIEVANSDVTYHDSLGRTAREILGQHADLYQEISGRAISKILNEAVKANLHSVVESVIKRFSNSNEWSPSLRNAFDVALYEAVSLGRSSIVEYFLKKGASANGPSPGIGGTVTNLLTEDSHQVPIIAAVYTENFEIVKLLVKYNADVNKFGRLHSKSRHSTTAINVATEKKNQKIVELLASLCG